MGRAIGFRFYKEMKVMLLSILGAFLFGMLICFLVVKIIPDEGEVTTAYIATFMAIMAVVFIEVIAGGIGMQNDFFLAVSMSHCRKRFLLEEGILSVLSTLLSMLLCVLLYFADGWILRVGYPGVPIDKELDMTVVYRFLTENPINLLAVLLALVAIRLLIGALYLKFGQWAFWGIWLFCMSFGMICGRMGKKLHGGSEGVMQLMRTLSQLAASLHGLFFQILVIILSLITILASVLMLRKQEAKG